MFKFATIFLAAVAAVEGASLVQRDSCDSNIHWPVCQLSNGSPLISDCNEALNRLSGRCHVSNGAGTHCSTLSSYKSCKVDMCGDYNTWIKKDIDCKQYLRDILNVCSGNGRVGGYHDPGTCAWEVGFPSIPTTDYHARLQFSHT